MNDRPNAEVYPQTAKNWDALNTILTSASGCQDELDKLADAINEHVGAYEHGEADTEDISGSWRQDTDTQRLQIVRDVLEDFFLSYALSR